MALTVECRMQWLAVVDDQKTLSSNALVYCRCSIDYSDVMVSDIGIFFFTFLFLLVGLAVQFCSVRANSAVV